MDKEKEKQGHLSAEQQIEQLGLQGTSAESFKKLSQGDRDSLLSHFFSSSAVLREGKPVIGQTNLGTGKSEYKVSK